MNRLALATSLAIGSLVSPARAIESCVQHTPFSYRAGTELRDFALADVDGDTDIDAVFLTKLGGVASVLTLVNDGLGAFTTGSSTPLAGVTFARSLAAGDVDGDLDVDLVVFTDATMRVLKNAAGTFTETGSFAAAVTTTQPQLVDLDGDTDLDLANALSVWSNDGSGAFTFEAALSQSVSMDWFCTGDFDGDGDIDLSGARSGASTLVRTWTNGGGFAFTGSEITNPAGVIRDFDSGDLDGDTLADRVYVQLGNLRVLRGTGALDTFTFLPSHQGTASGIGDLDGDGDNDVICSDGDVQVFTNQGSTFTLGQRIDAGPSSDVLIADLDGDGANDVACLERGAGTFSARLSRVGFNAPVELAARVFDQLLLADLDGDGDLDATGRAWAGGPPVWRNTGGGAFASVSFPGAFSDGPIRAIDMNGDALPELVRADAFAGSIETSFNAGGMSFSSFFGQNSLAGAHDIASGDLDHDGDQDIVLGPWHGTVHQLVVLRNDGTGLLTASAIPTLGGGRMCVEMADVTGDTWLDVVATTATLSGVVYVFVNDGTGVLQAPVTLSSFASSAVTSALAVADVDRDGDVDLVVGTQAQPTLTVMTNDGSGGFTLHQRFAIDLDPSTIVLDALDGGATPDLCVLEGQNTGSILPVRASVWSNLGDGTFAYRSTHVMGGAPLSCAVADLDRDGRNEIYLASRDLTFGTGDGRVQRFDYTGGCSAGTVTCEGDGSVAACPCGNSGLSGHGCANSLFAGGAQLSASGVASVTSDTMLLACGDMTGNVCIFVQGATLTAPQLLDDGLTCLGSIIRLGSRSIVGAGAVFPQLGNTSVSQRGQIPPSGGTFHYQSFYRNASVTFCPPATSNRTNALTITWAP